MNKIEKTKKLLFLSPRFPRLNGLVKLHSRGEGNCSTVGPVRSLLTQVKLLLWICSVFLLRPTPHFPSSTYLSPLGIVSFTIRSLEGPPYLVYKSYMSLDRRRGTGRLHECVMSYDSRRPRPVRDMSPNAAVSYLSSDMLWTFNRKVSLGMKIWGVWNVCVWRVRRFNPLIRLWTCLSSNLSLISGCANVPKDLHLWPFFFGLHSLEGLH